MTGTLAAFVPIWSITGLGYLLSRFAVLGERAQEVLTRLAFLVAMPAVLFGTLVDTPFSALLDPGLLAFGAGIAAAGLAGFAMARWVFRKPRGERVVIAMASCYTNSTNLGIPVALQVLGSSTFIVTVLMFQSLVMMPSMLIMLESGKRRRTGVPWRRSLVSLPLRNPMIAAALLGVVVGATGWRPPSLLLQPIHTLGGAGVATALLVLGMSLHPDKLAAAELTAVRRRWEIAAVVALKVAAQPAVALGAGWALHLPRPALLAAVLCAALPAAQNIFIATTRYPIDSRFVRDCVMFSTLSAMGTLSLLAWWLGP